MINAVNQTSPRTAHHKCALPKHKLIANHKALDFTFSFDGSVWFWLIFSSCFLRFKSVSSIMNLKLEYAIVTFKAAKKRVSQTSDAAKPKIATKGINRNAGKGGKET